MTNILLYIIIAIVIWTSSAILSKGSNSYEINIVIKEIIYSLEILLSNIKKLLSILIKDLIRNSNPTNTSCYAKHEHQGKDISVVNETNYSNTIEKLYSQTKEMKD